jgi:glyoxylase I family protein
VDQVPALLSTVEFDHYGISVTDLGRSLAFYCDILGGIVLLAPHPVDEFSCRRAVLWLNGMDIDLNEHTMNTGEAFEPVRTGLDHLAFSVSSYDALVGWAAQLDGKAVACSPIRNVEGVGEAFDFRDPDGIQIEFWHRDHDGRWGRYVKQKLKQSGDRDATFELGSVRLTTPR